MDILRIVDRIASLAEKYSDTELDHEIRLLRKEVERGCKPEPAEDASEKAQKELQRRFASNEAREIRDAQPRVVRPDYPPEWQ
ncbi:MAG: hypothetical protein ACLPHP_16395 [Candidatus Sulfotelmatobacter sp.]